MGSPRQELRVRAELVATVLAVLVEAGEPVRSGQGLVLLESMKMEIPVPAPLAGRVRRLAVEVGDLVQEGDLIAVLEPAAETGDAGDATSASR